jgi:hypothetical protein
MQLKTSIYRSAIGCCFILLSLQVSAHDIYFCGERIPLNERVAKKLMDIIKKQINYGTVNIIKKRESDLKVIEMYLEKTGLPDDFKYLAIVESGFKNVVSSAGAAGYWQLMPATARQYGLIVNELIDERNDFYKSTHAACKVLAGYYLEIRKKHRVSSWALTAAAYNFGSGNMGQAIKNQGKNYFEMDLNKETAEYVYKIIAVKELFEYPELYMKDFGYNLFNTKITSPQKSKTDATNTDNPDFGTMSVKVSTDDGYHPADLTDKNYNSKKTVKPQVNSNVKSEKYVFAHITGNYDNFTDSSEINITLEDPLLINNSFTNAGNMIKGIGWKIDDKIFIDLGYGKKLIIIDYDNKKHDGILQSALKDKARICLKVTEFRT